MTTRSLLPRVVAGLAALLVVALLYALFRDQTPPQVILTPSSGPASAATEFRVAMRDEASGLKALTVSVEQNGKATPVLTLDLGGLPSLDKTFTLPDKLLAEGPFRLTLEVTDTSLGRFGRGNKALVAGEYLVDTRPPLLTLTDPAAINVNQGGVGFVAFTANEDLRRAGVAVAQHFFPAFRQEDGKWLCLFVWPWNLPRQEFSPQLLAEDLAGNPRKLALSIQPFPKTFRHDRIAITDAFLDAKMPQFDRYFPGEKNMKELFLKVNRQLRMQDEAELLKLAQDTEPRMLWSGAFHRMKNAAPMAAYADTRDYYYGNEKIDTQTHMGQDLASLQNAPIEAGNAGRVVRADFFGIYGNCVILDHGLGLQSIYAHLSQIEVKAGDRVTKGQLIGRSGATGMAGGDHLHYGVAVGGLQAQPYEWWDDHWIRDNITLKLNPAAHKPTPPPAAPAKSGKSPTKSPAGKKR